MFATVHNVYLPQSLCLRFRTLKHWRCIHCHKTGRDGRCTCFYLSPCSAKSLRTTYHPEQRENSSGPLVAVTTVVPTPTLTVCGPPSHHSILPRSTVTTGVHLRCKSYHLHAWRLSCSTTKQQDFQERSLGTQQHLGDPQQTACLTIGAFASITGPQDRELIRLVPQLLK